MNKQLWWKLKLTFSLIPGFITSLPQSTVYCNIIFKTVLSDSLMNQELTEISEGWERNQNKSHIGTHCTVVVQLQLCNDVALKNVSNALLSMLLFPEVFMTMK